MTTSSRISDLSPSQNHVLKKAVETKLHELDSVSDETLADYVMVLLANRHSKEKVLNELEDFLGPMAVEDFVDWLFTRVDQLKKGDGEVGNKKSPNDEAMWRKDGIEGVGGAKETKGVTAVTKGRAFAFAVQKIIPTTNESQSTTQVGRVGRDFDMQMRDALPQDQEKERRRETKDGHRQGSERDSRPRHRHRSRSPVLPMNGNHRLEPERSPLPYSRSHHPHSRRGVHRSPTPPPSRRRIVKYQSIRAREIEQDQGMLPSPHPWDHPLDRYYDDTKTSYSISNNSQEIIGDARELIRAATIRDSGISTDLRRERRMETHRQVARIDDKMEEKPPHSSTYLSNAITSPRMLDGDDERKQTRCSYWPNCKAGESCPFVHPSEPCKHFPNCAFKDSCLFIHPAIPCKFQDRCQNPTCNYVHSSPATNRPGSFTSLANPFHPPSAITCRFFPNCKNSQCPFLHPSTVMCKFGEQCQRSACPFTHPQGRQVTNRAFINAPCRYGKSCAKADCPFQHPSGRITSPTADSNTDVGNLSPMDGPQLETGPMEVNQSTPAIDNMAFGTESPVCH